MLEEENQRFLPEWYDNFDEIPANREEASLSGSILFMHTKACRNGHHPVRLTSSNRCAVCQRRGRRSYFLKNRKNEYLISVRRQKERYKEDPSFRVAAILRDCVKRAFRMIKRRKSEKTFDVLGYTVEDFMGKIEEKFQEGMLWDNHGTSWELDHVIPMAAFNLEIPDGLEYVNSIDNLQPLWKEDHTNKSNKDRKDINMFKQTGLIPEHWEYIAKQGWLV